MTTTKSKVFSAANLTEFEYGDVGLRMTNEHGASVFITRSLIRSIVQAHQERGV